MDPLSTRKAGSLYGLYYGAFLVVFSFLLYSSKLEDNLLLNLTGWGIFIGVMAMAMRKFKEGNEGYMSFGQGMGIGFFYTLVAGIISGLFDTFYLTVVNPQMLQDQLDETIAIMESNPNMTDEQIEDTAELAQSFISHPVFLFTIALLGAFIIGIIVALVVAAVMKKDNPELDLEEE
ncbi:MAG: DUF4199 domain-containing protein [Bacteroidetes bacterium]|nr:DUF4199 domain-containing protein [Bacteroidota bacterium]